MLMHKNMNILFLPLFMVTLTDGKLTAGDAAFIAKNLAEQKGHTLPAYADFTGDGKVTAYDAAMIAKYLAEQSLKN